MENDELFTAEELKTSKKKSKKMLTDIAELVNELMTSRRNFRILVRHFNLTGKQVSEILTEHMTAADKEFINTMQG